MEAYYVKIAVWIIVISGLAKVITASMEMPILSKHDPVFTFVSYRQIALFAGIVELVAVFVIMRQRHLALPVLCWLSTIFLLYRIGLWSVGSHEPCPCFGSMLEWAGLSKGVEKGLAIILFVFLLLGSYSWSLVRMVEDRRERRTFSNANL